LTVSVYHGGMTDGTRVIAYTRCSTDDQASSGAGLEAQRDAIRARCAERGWEIVRYAEDHASGKSLAGRPELAAAIDAIERGEASALVVAKLDRLARSVHDFSGIVARSAKRGWSLVVIDLELDMLQPSGKLMANILASFAEFERDLIGKRTKEALAVRRAHGVRLGRPPGPPNPARKQIGRLRQDGLTLAEIASRLNEEGVPTSQGGARWYPSTVRAVLRRGEPDAGSSRARSRIPGGTTGGGT
jgi:DNA invertase Pin-like site-specific DNA recombinase